jgi:peptidoglycan/LPS O-acetylase OafA/YrhL
MMAQRPASGARLGALGWLRLAFAGMVIIEHAPELIDGNRSRELATRLFGTMGLGELAVDGFFLISGYLITSSCVQSASLRGFLTKRVLRIYPGYLVSFWLCLLVEAPLAGAPAADFAPAAMLRQVLRAIALLPPEAAGVFADAPLHYLNGSLWTIAYEFRCYLLAALLGRLGAYGPRGRHWLAGGVLLLLALNGAGVLAHAPTIGGFLLGVPSQSLRFFALFGAGAVYYLYRRDIPLTGTGAACCAVLLLLLLARPHLVELGVAVCGGYLIFWAARRAPGSGSGQSVDISYGLYLYAWPVQMLIIQHDPAISPWLAACLTAAAACVLGYASWILVEQPALRLVRQTLRPVSQAAQ